MTSFLLWLEDSRLGVGIRENPSILGFPFILFLHTLGLAMLAGVSVALDVWLLRIRAFAADLRLTGLIRVMWVGLGINTVSGLALLIAYPAKALTNPVFYLKMLLVAAGVYAVARINGELFPRGRAVAGTSVTVAAKRWAMASIAIWVATVFAGRLLAYTYNVLFAYELV